MKTYYIVDYTFKNPYTNKEEDYGYHVRKDDGYIEAIKDFFDKRDVFIKGSDSDIWNAIVDLEELMDLDVEKDWTIFNAIFEDEEEFLKEYYKDEAYDEFLMEKEEEHEDEESEEEEEEE